MLVALATSSALPSLEPCDRPLLSALADLGVDARATVWSDPTVDWAAQSAVLIRSTWDSHLRPAPFLARAAVEATGARPLYARADIATDNEGRPRLQELELTEPCLFLALDERAPGRLARAIVARL